MKSSAPRPPPVCSDQPTYAPLAGSATVAASDSPSSRAASGSTPAVRAVATSASRAADSESSVIQEIPT